MSLLDKLLGRDRKKEAAEATTTPPEPASAPEPAEAPASAPVAPTGDAAPGEPAPEDERPA